MIVLIPYINLLKLSWIKNVCFEEYGAFKVKDFFKVYNVFFVSKGNLSSFYLASQQLVL